jgi:arylsulfatase A-like enzyme
VLGTTPLADASVERRPDLDGHAPGAERQRVRRRATPTTPTLDALAADGVLFENAFSTAAFTLPGHMSMFTGLWLRTHGSLTPLMRSPLEHRTLPELLPLGRLGDGRVQLCAGVDHVVASGFAAASTSSTSTTRQFGKPPHPSDNPALPFTNGLAWIRAHRDEPFFAFLHNYQVHMPYDAPPTVRLPLRRRARRSAQGRVFTLSLRARGALRRRQLRALLEGLDALGVADRTLVIVTPDHGEGFARHGLFDHSAEVYDEIARIPAP